MIFAFTRFWRLLSKEQRVNLSVQKYYIIVPCEDVIEESIKFKRKFTVTLQKRLSTGDGTKRGRPFKIIKKKKKIHARSINSLK